MITLNDDGRHTLIVDCGLAELIEVVDSAEGCGGEGRCAYCCDDLGWVAEQLRRAGVQHVLHDYTDK
jgi:hypothetical protein